MEGLRAMSTKNKKRLLFAALGIAALAALAACGGGGGGQDSLTARESEQGAGSGNAISWAPQAVVFPANPGARQDVQVKLTTTRSLSNASITVVPELRGIVTVSPATLGALTAGQSTVVTITVAPGASESLRLVDGTIRVIVGSSTIAKPLPVRISLVAQETINGVAVPPEPPPDLNNATLAGFDTNRNGVRDDVERWIVRTTQSSMRKQKNLLVDAAATQRGLLATTTETAVSAANDGILAIECFRYLGIPKEQRGWRESLARTINTEDRIRAHEMYQDRINGQVFGMVTEGEERQACKFDVESLPN
jgi:hypothetical protein